MWLDSSRRKFIHMRPNDRSKAELKHLLLLFTFRRHHFVTSKKSLVLPVPLKHLRRRFMTLFRSSATALPFVIMKNIFFPEQMLESHVSKLRSLFSTRPWRVAGEKTSGITNRLWKIWKLIFLIYVVLEVHTERRSINLEFEVIVEKLGFETRTMTNVFSWIAGEKNSRKQLSNFARLKIPCKFIQWRSLRHHC